MKWFYRKYLNSYFEKQSKENWIEFRDDRFYAEYEEIRQIFYTQQTEFEFTLRRTSDGIFLNLTKDSVYSDQNELPLSDGFWSSQSRKSEGK